MDEIVDCLMRTVLGCIAVEKQGGSWERKSQGRKQGKPFVQTELFFSQRGKWYSNT